jgi:hypothetical protein
VYSHLPRAWVEDHAVAIIEFPMVRALAAECAVLKLSVSSEDVYVRRAVPIRKVHVVCSEGPRSVESGRGKSVTSVRCGDDYYRLLLHRADLHWAG